MSYILLDSEVKVLDLQKYGMNKNIKYLAVSLVRMITPFLWHFSPKVRLMSLIISLRTILGGLMVCRKKTCQVVSIINSKVTSLFASKKK